jgi:hypothetical protein
LGIPLTISWESAADALNELIPQTARTLDSYRIGESAEQAGLTVKWHRIEAPLDLNRCEILKAILTELPRALVGRLIVITHESFLGGQPYSLDGQDLEKSISEGPTYLFDGGFIIIARSSGIVVAYEYEDDHSVFCVIDVLEKQR